MIRDLTDPQAAVVIKRHKDFWDAAADAGRPLFRFGGIRYARPVLEDQPPAHIIEPPDLWEGKRFSEGVEKRYDEQGLVHDDFLNTVSCGVATEPLVGCPVVREAGSVWAKPCFEDWHQLDDYRVQDSIWYQRLMANTEIAVEAVDPTRYPFSGAVFRGAVDMAMAMMSADVLALAVMDHPQELKDLLARITDIVIDTATAQSELLPRHDGGQFHNFAIWTPGSTLCFTVDAAWMFSPTCYEEFFLPCDVRVCEAFDAPMVHLHSASRAHFPTWSEIGNLRLEAVIDEVLHPTGELKAIGPGTEELLPLFKDLCGRTSMLIDGGTWTDELIERATAELRPGSFAIRGSVADPEAFRERYMQDGVA